MDRDRPDLQIKGVLFDKDGTLFDFHRTWVPILEEAALMAARGEASLVPHLMGAGGYDPVTGRVASGSVIAAGDTPDLAFAWRSLAPGWEASELVARLDKLFSLRAPILSAPVTDLAVFLRLLSGRGLKVGIATNDSAASAHATIDRFGLREIVAFHCGYDSGHGVKPAPGMVHAFCEAMAFHARDVAVVGDNRHDLDMGKAAGVGLRIGVLTGTSEHGDLAPHADFVIGSIVELPALLDGLC